MPTHFLRPNWPIHLCKQYMKNMNFVGKFCKTQGGHSHYFEWSNMTWTHGENLCFIIKH